ncbi:molecular chaperone Tir [Paenibacillus cisolokensis]|uniref:Molecular chaperone Tir n=1 Tax=Paenibacillus cisolokensis TaxID=1658519 RepID=A0ABQ4NC69_9BACL|nr:TIR domain-containing protein [Paenibacillus cisolokensis]GIQ65476.1 molecular chaperone Tir [Paenibacillus cisolokensis]
MDNLKKRGMTMGLPRTFIGFSSTDIHYYRLMQAWKQNERIDFHFTDCQLHSEIDSENEAYIKRRCRERINMAGYYIMLIGEDTRYKHKYVRWEAEVAKEKGCTIIGVNLNKSRSFDNERTPAVIKNIGAVFVTLHPKIIKYALENYKMKDSGDYVYKDSLYQELGIV